MRAIVKTLSLVIVAGAMWVMGGCSSGGVSVAAYDEPGYTYSQPGYYYYRHDPWDNHRPYYYYRDRDYHHHHHDNDDIRVRGSLNVRDW